MKSLVTWAYLFASTLLLSSPVHAQQPPTSKPSAQEIKAQCIEEGKKAGMSAALLDDYVKKCINRNSGGNVGDHDGKK